ncbi:MULTISPECIES: hypothetical protein [Halobacterium]|uniref:hypothetical protein n=1 Tax=Halobacterium TaxID=2239 RepID=UPI000A49DDB5|nr:MULTISPECIES: hypothetical protein [Halobacterium]MCG1002205.1 hypothetical protein [Halobacterium noricense]
MALQHRRRSQSNPDSAQRRIEVSEMTAAGVAAYADTHEEAFIERRGGKTFLVTVE